MRIIRKSRALIVSFALLSSLVSGSNSFASEVVFEQDTRIPLGYINVVSKSGSVNDPKGKYGLTNFMGEMLLRGTKQKTREQIDLAFDQMGGRLGVETRAEALVFRGAVLSSQTEPYLKLVKEILTTPSFPEAEIKKLKSEIISSLKEEQGSDPSLASRKFSEFLFQGHPYGIPILGKIKDIQSITVRDLKDQYDRLIRDNLLLVIGRGDADKGMISNWTQQLVETRKRSLAEKPESDKTKTVQVEPPVNADHRRLLIVNKPDRTQTQMNIGQIGVKLTDSDYFPLYLGNYAFGGGSFSAILMVEIRVKQGWSYGANSSFRHGLQPRSWHAHLFPASKDAAPALTKTIQLIEDLKKYGISKQQYEFAQQSLVNSAGFMYNTPRKRGENILLEKTLNLPEGFMESYGKELQKVSLDQVNSSLKKFLKPEALTITVVATAEQLKEPLAQAAQVPLSEVVVVPYTQE